MHVIFTVSFLRRGGDDTKAPVSRARAGISTRASGIIGMMQTQRKTSLLFLSLTSALSLALGCAKTDEEDPLGPRFVAVGTAGTILTSDDGSVWRPKSSGIKTNILSITYGAGTFVAEGEGGAILTSSTGIAWFPQNSPTDTDLSDVVYTGTRFVAVGGSFETGAETVVSDDGAKWERVVSPGEQMFHAVAHRNDTLIAAAYARSDLQTPALFTLVPGDKNWKESVGPDFYDSLLFEDSIYTVGGASTSRWSEGTGGSSTALSGASSMRAIAQGNSQFVVVG